jgi:octaprenyl-diphosphate synthase
MIIDNGVFRPTMDSDNTALNRYREYFAKINEELDKALSSRVALVKDIGNHSLLGHGKRLRPLFFVLSCQLCNYEGEDIYHLSTIFEYVHAASLLHDDVLDNAETRRRKPSANQVWGNQAAVLEGDFLYSKASCIAVGANNLAFLKRLTEATTQMTEAQILELTLTHNCNTSKKEYLEIITGKTAVLMSAACACGAIIAGAEQWAVNCLSQFGINTGIAFQLTDDLLDYTSSERVFGKPVGKDLREGKITLPLIYTLAKLEDSERKRLETLFTRKLATEKDYQDVIKLVSRNESIDQIRAEAHEYVDKAARSLSSFPDSTVKRNLLELNQYIIERNY